MQQTGNIFRLQTWVSKVNLLSMTRWPRPTTWSPMRQVDWCQRLIRYWCLIQPSPVVMMIRRASPRTCRHSATSHCRQTSLDSLRTYFKCRQIEMNGWGGYCQDELSIILMLIHAMTADDLANRKHASMKFVAMGKQANVHQRLWIEVNRKLKSCRPNRFSVKTGRKLFQRS